MGLTTPMANLPILALCLALQSSAMQNEEMSRRLYDMYSKTLKIKGVEAPPNDFVPQEIASGRNAEIFKFFPEKKEFKMDLDKIDEKNGKYVKLIIEDPFEDFEHVSRKLLDLDHI